MACCNKPCTIMARPNRTLVVLSLALVAGCAPSPLYFNSTHKRPGTGGEIPRDGRGEPIWSAITPPPPDSIYQGPPPAPVKAPPKP
jgi:hypothetical protein